MRAKKGQTFNRYSEDTKKEAVRLRVGEGWAYSRIMEKFGIKSEIQIIFSSAEEEKKCLFESTGRISKKAQSKLARGGKLDFEARYKLGDLSLIEFQSL
ncbi:hypothetical protein [Paenibacillus sp. FSL L8-0470]|uniref:hypothetical protein n=1 Tax=Paenibacillus sp. FSL L8-0470 TaxID=2954688 RepID=UPI004047C5F7